MTIELGYLMLSVANLDRATEFFGALFDWQFEREPDAPYAHVANTALPMGLVARGPKDLRFLYFRVADITAMTESVVRLGGKVLERGDSPSGLNAVCDDGQGTLFSLWQPAEGY